MSNLAELSLNGTGMLIASCNKLECAQIFTIWTTQRHTAAGPNANITAYPEWLTMNNETAAEAWYTTITLAQRVSRVVKLQATSNSATSKAGTSQTLCSLRID